MKNDTNVQTKLVLHHVGGRAGSICFPIPKKFEPDIINVLYEADTSCVDQIKTYWIQNQSQTEVYPYCLSNTVGSCNFYLNYDPYTSSIYPFNEKYKDYYYPYKDSGMDYVFGDSCQPMQTLTLETTTLDSLIAEGKVGAPDFLSLDTQGCELDILKGAQKCLEDHVSALYIEVEFHALYKDQPLFHDLCAFLNPLGFELIDVTLNKRYPFRGKWGMRGEGMATDGEALFFKIPERIKGSLDERALQLNKLAFIALIYNRFEYMQLCMSDPGFHKLENSGHYLQLISAIEQELQKLPERPFPIFSDKYSAEASKARFENTNPTKQNFKGRLRQIFMKSEPLKRAWNFLHRFKFFSKNLKEKVGKYWEDGVIFYCIKMRKNLSGLEIILLQNELQEQYELLVKNRIIDASIYKNKINKSHQKLNN